MSAFVGAVGRTFSSLRVRNYRLYFMGQVISVSGTWMQTVAQAWLVLHLTGSGFALGLTAGLQFAPIVVLGLWGGLLADRLDKRRTVVVTQSSAAVLALVLGLLTATGVVQIWMVWALALCLGLVTAIDTPARQSFVAEMVGPHDVGNAVSLNSAVFNAARIVGPSIAGVLIATVGTAPCFFVNAASYLGVVGAMLLMRPGELARAAPVRPARGQLMEAVRYAWSDQRLRLPLLLMAVVGSLAFNFTVSLPLMARFAFQGGPDVLGAMLAALGVGAVAGALGSASLNRPNQMLLVASALAFGLLLLSAALAPNLLFELALLPPAGAAGIVFQASTNSLLQLHSEPAFRGRVLAIYVILFVGSTVVGGPTVGWVGEHLGPRFGLGLGGGAAALAGAAAVVALLRRAAPELRPPAPRRAP